MNQNPPNPAPRTLRLDGLLFELARKGVQTHLQPRIPQVDLWETMGLGDATQNAIERLRISRHPIEHVKVGNLEVPVKIIYGLIQYFTARRSNNVR